MPIVILKHTATGEYRNRIPVEDGAMPPAGFTYEPDTQANRDAFNAFRIAELTADRDTLRQTARDFLLNDQRPEMKTTRALSLLVLDEVNALRAWDMSLKAAIAAATSLANLQTRVAALSNLPARTSSQLLDAMITKLLSGDAD